MTEHEVSTADGRTLLVLERGDPGVSRFWCTANHLDAVHGWLLARM